MKSDWRYIPPLDAPGDVQMALDTWLVKQHAQGLHPPTLRFYTWSPPAISLGYHQRHVPESWQHLRWNQQPIALIRRPSGGRAVLHQGDLTYAVITSGMTGNRMQVYQQLCEFLIQGWRSLGIDLHYGQAGRGYIHNPNCFGTATTADLVTSDGTKLIGSAQLCRGHAVLQHGSMPIHTDLKLFQTVFGTELKPFVCPDHLLNAPLLPAVITALTAAAASCFAVNLIPQPLTDDEWATIQRSLPYSPSSL